MATLSAVTRKCFDENMLKQIKKAEPIIMERCQKSANKDLERVEKAAREAEEKMMREADKEAAKAKKEAEKAAKEAAAAAEKTRRAEERVLEKERKKREAEDKKAADRALKAAEAEAKKAAAAEERAKAALEKANQKALEASKKEALRQKYNAKIKKYQDNIRSLKSDASEVMRNFGVKSEKYKKYTNAIATLELKIKAVKDEARANGIHKFASPKTKKASPLLIRKSSSSSTRKASRPATTARAKSVPRQTAMAMADPLAEMTVAKSRKSSRPKSASPQTRKSKTILVEEPEEEPVFEFEEEEVVTPGGMTELVDIVGSPITERKASSTKKSSSKKSSSSIQSF